MWGVGWIVDGSGFIDGIGRRIRIGVVGRDGGGRLIGVVAVGCDRRERHLDVEILDLVDLRQRRQFIERNAKYVSNLDV